jgi:hypothetical protein
VGDSDLDQLLSRYAEAAATHRSALAAGSTNQANQAADTIATVYRALRDRGPDAQRLLLGLLDHPDPAVRVWAGAHALEFAPDQGEPVLEELAGHEGVVGLNAETTLEVWRSGDLHFF